MAGALSDQEGYFLLIARSILEGNGVNVTKDDEGLIRNFLRQGVAQLITMSPSKLQIVEQDFTTKLSRVANPSLSVRDILRKLCPCNPFC